jgi:hypothetical protein
MLMGYFDGSGSHADSKVLTLCGFLGELDSWLNFADSWNAVLDKPEWPNRPKELHMYDCAHALEDFEGWSYAQRLALVGDCVDVVIQSGIFAVGSGAFTDIFSRLDSNDKLLLQSERLGDRYDLVFQYCVQQVAHWTKTLWDGEKVGMIFDTENKPQAAEYLKLHAHYRASDRFGPYLAGAGFESSVDMLPVQAADLLAYGTYQWALKQRFPLLGEPDFSSIPAFLRMITSMSADGGIYTVESLRTLLAEITRKRPLP